MADVFACLFRSLSVVSEDIDLVPNKKKAKKSHTKDKPSNGSVYTPASVKRRKIQDEDFDAESSSSSCSSSASSSKSSSLPTFPSPVSAPSRSKAIEVRETGANFLLAPQKITNASTDFNDPQQADNHRFEVFYASDGPRGV
jgi:hypothetical protein